MASRHSSLALLSQYIGDLNCCLDLETLPARAVGRLRRLVPADVAAYQELDPETGDTYTASSPEQGLTLRQSRFLFELHLTHLADRRRCRTVICASAPQDGSPPEHDGIAVPAGVAPALSRSERWLAVTIPLEDRGFLGLALLRSGRQFSDLERGMVELIHPHLERAHVNAAAMGRSRSEVDALRNWLAGPQRALVVLTSSGRIKDWTPEARHWIRDYCNARFPHVSYVLPECFHSWYRDQRAVSDMRRGIPAARAPLVVKRPDRELYVHLITDHVRDEHILLLEQRCRQVRPDSLSALGLTQREADVLYWVAQGKTNGEVATILSISARTVQKHLEHIYPKLAVGTRTAAAVRAQTVFAGLAHGVVAPRG